MRAFIVAALFATATLAPTAAEAAMAMTHPPVGRPTPKACPAGQSWQFGCVKYAPTPPGKLFGACLRKGWGCFRAATPIQ
ncbi:MAG: hypothetical protein ACHQAY_25170 [Hyphomicrobiales bacterium]